VGVALDITKDLPRLAGALRGSGGVLAVGGIIHGLRDRNYLEAGLGALDVTFGIASLFPPADFVTGPYFAVRLGMGLVETAAYLSRPPELGSGCRR
jgi:hypothetical protein